MALDSRILQGLFVAHMPGSICITQVARVRVFPIRQLFFSIVYAGDTECNALFYYGRTGAVRALVYISPIICRDVKIK